MSPLPPTGKDLPPLREVIARHSLSARKALGQNFLLDLNLTRRIVRTAGVRAGERVLEIGPGPGGLTRALLEVGARVIAVEKDRRCIDSLGELTDFFPQQLTVIEGDALVFDETTLADAGEPLKVVANLPYNIATALLVKWLTPKNWPSWFSSLTLMFQREVAQRITAVPGSKAYGRLSILAQWRCAAQRCFDVPRTAFVPPPRVTSSIVSLIPGKPLAEAEFADLERVVATAFGQRRKMLRASLKGLEVPVDDLLARAGLDPTLRAERLTIAEFCALARAYSALR